MTSDKAIMVKRTWNEGTLKMNCESTICNRYVHQERLSSSHKSGFLKFLEPKVNASISYQLTRHFNRYVPL